MEDNFDFDKVGKRMPYKVPADFFDTVTENTLAEAERRNSIKKQITWFNWPAMSVAASLVLLLAFGYVFYLNRTEQKNQVAVLDKEAEHKAPSEIVSQPETTVAIVAANESLPEKVKGSTPTPVTVKPVAKPQQPESQPIQLAQADKAETLDDVLANISDDELVLLAAVAETDLNVYEQTFERDEQAN